MELSQVVRIVNTSKKARKMMPDFHPSITPKVVSAALMEENTGFCAACGKKHTGIEPDAENYRCDRCDNASVYGAAMIALLMA